MTATLGRSLLCETIGTFVLTFVSAAAICADSYTGGDLGLAGIALAYGLTLAAVVTATAHVSGAHVNPAITLAAVLSRAIEPLQAAAYVGAQIAGAVLAGGVLRGVFASEVWEPVALGAPLLGPGVSPGTGMLLEAVLTATLVFVVLQLAASVGAPHHVHGLAIGAMLTACVFVGQPLTGAALNPARALGPALAAGNLSAQYVWWIGPLLGSVIGALWFGIVQGGTDTEPIDPSPEQDGA